MVTHVIISLIMDIVKDLESNEGPIWPKDMHDIIVMLEYPYIGDMFAKVITKKKRSILTMSQKVPSIPSIGWWRSEDYASPYTIGMFIVTMPTRNLRNLLASIHREVVVVLNMDDPNVHMCACGERARLFKKVVLMTFENLDIVQHRNTLKYVTIHGGRYWSQVQQYNWSDEMFTCKKQHPWCWILQQDMSFQ